MGAGGWEDCQFSGLSRLDGCLLLLLREGGMAQVASDVLA